jgi:hypothetical protein
LRTKTWPELAKWFRLCAARDLFRLEATSLISIDADHAKTWRADMIPWSERNPEAFAGLHNQGRRVVMLYDEASAIPDIIWETSEGFMSDADTERLWLAFGNPTKSVGRFHECFPGGRHAIFLDQVNKSIPEPYRSLIKIDFKNLLTHMARTVITFESALRESSPASARPSSSPPPS